jgi:hypothetical protein
MEPMTESSTSPAGPAGNQPGKHSRMSRLKAGYQAMKPCFLALIAAVMVPLIFIFVEQAAEVLRCLAEGPAHTEGAKLGRILWIAIGLTCVSLAGWWFSLALLYFKFPDTPPETTGRAKELLKWLPPIIGVIPSFGLGLAFFLAASPQAGSSTPFVLKEFGAVCFVYGIVFFWWFKRKQNYDLFHSSTRFHEMSAQHRGVTYGALVMSTLLFLTLLIWPVRVPQMMGSTTLILLAAASWIAYGSVVIYAGHRWRLPLIRILLVGVILFSFWNSNHGIRYLAGAPTVVPTFENQYLSWHSNLCARYPKEANPPVIVVATAGGGIRAAVWTATVLGELQDRNPAFADHVFAISGVSGGSLGAAVFDGLVKCGTTGHHRVLAQKILAHDFLSPTLAYLLFPDLVQQFLPCRIGLFGDRATALEQGWESAWRRTMGNDLFSADFYSLWRGNDGRSVPSLFLNGTSVENGQRMVVCNVQLDGSFVMAEDVNAQLTNANIRLSTAVDMSTRFSYVSPSGRFNDGSHVVDGGYFENSGTATVMDILDAIELADFGNTNPPVQIVIVISNDPHENDAVPPQSEFLGEALTPFHSLLSTRQARGTYSETLLRMRIPRSNFYRFSLSRGAPAADEVPLPLGWSLSRRAIEEMNRRLQQQKEPSLTVLDRLPRQAK